MARLTIELEVSRWHRRAAVAIAWTARVVHVVSPALACTLVDAALAVLRRGTRPSAPARARSSRR